MGRKRRDEKGIERWRTGEREGGSDRKEGMEDRREKRR